jgi:hypothetical protein
LEGITKAPNNKIANLTAFVAKFVSFPSTEMLRLRILAYFNKFVGPESLLMLMLA